GRRARSAHGSGRRRRARRGRRAPHHGPRPRSPAVTSRDRGRARGKPDCGAPRRAPSAGQRNESAQPLTLVFRAEPALKRGTLPPGIVIRSPVRGFTPWRGPRSATWNLPKPVKLTSSPAARAPVIASRTASTASLAAFLLPSRSSDASWSRNSALVTSRFLLGVEVESQSNNAGRRETAPGAKSGPEQSISRPLGGPVRF